MNIEKNKTYGILEPEIRLTGTQVNYYFVCKRKLWLFSHNIGLETTSDLVLMGKLLHENSYRREKLKELEFDKIKIDFIRNSNEIHEIKKSRKIEKAHFYQLLYYIYFLKRITKMTNITGIIDYPLLKKRVSVNLSADYEKEMNLILKEIEEIIRTERPPEPEWISYCKKCAYAELCWS